VIEGMGVDGGRKSVAVAVAGSGTVGLNEGVGVCVGVAGASTGAAQEATKKATRMETRIKDPNERLVMMNYLLNEQ
jgi:hypothetical protein